MAQQIGAAQRQDNPTAINPSLVKGVEDFVKTATYAAPEVVSFPLNGLRVTEVVAVTGNTGNSN